MGEKSEQKRKYILKQARSVFAEKGFKAVTMKDIVERCEISRGGLYLHFGSTEEIFWGILQSDSDNEEDRLLEGITREMPMEDLLLMFLKEQKKEILRKKDDLSIATYEFFFLDREDKDKNNYVRRQFTLAVRVLAGILEEGNKRGEFCCPSPRTAAAGMMYTIEGMKICARTMGLNEHKVDRQLLYLIKELVWEEEE